MLLAYEITGDDKFALVTDATNEASTARDVVVLRDYHAENLVWLPDRADHARVGLLDYQDALVGHPAYDLASILEDARRDTSDALRQAMIALTHDGTSTIRGGFGLDDRLAVGTDVSDLELRLR